MEYDGGCTSSARARFVTRRSTRGGDAASSRRARRTRWWDEAWNVYHDSGGAGTQPFDFAESPVTLSPRNAYSRVTPSNAYTSGERFFEGVAALTSPASLTGWMREFYGKHASRPVTTLDLESHLVARSGQPELVDAFHRWIYGFVDPSPAPNVWLRDDPGAHRCGAVGRPLLGLAGSLDSQCRRWRNDASAADRWTRQLVLRARQQSRNRIGASLHGHVPGQAVCRRAVHVAVGLPAGDRRNRRFRSGARHVAHRARAVAGEAGAGGRHARVLAGGGAGAIRSPGRQARMSGSTATWRRRT